MRAAPLLLLLCAVTAHARDRVVPEDFYDIVEVDAPQWSPVDDRIVYVTSVANEKRTGYDRNLWLVNADGSGRRQLTHHEAADWAPRWSADGKRILFLSRRGGAPAAWVLPVEGGEPRRLTPPKVAVRSARWIPKSDAISFVTAVPVGSKTGRRKQLVKPEPTPLEKKGIRVIRRTIYFAGGGLVGSTREHLHSLDLRSGAVVQLTAGDHNVTEHDWAADGRRAVVAFNNAPDAPDVYVTRVAVVDRSGALRWLGRQGRLCDLAWRPGTSQVLMNDYQWEGGNNDLLCVDVDRDAWTEVQHGFDGEFFHLRWQRDGRRPLAVAEQGGSAQIWTLDAKTLRARRITSGKRQLGFHSQMFPTPSLSLSGDNERFVTTEAVSDQPRELVVGDVATGKTVQLTNVNRRWRRQHRTVTAKKWQLTLKSGQTMDAWIIPPADRRPGRRYPLVLQIHGGPDTMYGEHFMLEFQAIASAGIGVLYVNPPGSTGYGEAFKRASLHNWHGAHAALMAAVDAAIKRFPWIDGKRLGVAGGSYGGYMAAWIIGHTTRFKAAVTMRGLYDTASSTLTDDIPAAMKLMHPRSIWQDRLAHWKISPLAYVPRIRTPTLVIHSEKDARCPVNNADQFFRALRLHDVPAVLVRYADEGHGLSRNGRPDRRVDRLQRIVGWFKRWL